jgi:hypothetical protein
MSTGEGPETNTSSIHPECQPVDEDSSNFRRELLAEQATPRHPAGLFGRL